MESESEGSKAMAKLANNWTDINNFLQSGVGSQVSQDDFEKLHAITVTYTNINNVITAFQDEVYLDESDATEYDSVNHKLLPTALTGDGFANFNITSYALTGNLVVKLVPKLYTAKMSIYSCSSSLIKVKIDDIESEAFTAGIQMQLIISKEVA
jgi:hypothetical protein